jgi:hypothetical protein
MSLRRLPQMARIATWPYDIARNPIDAARKKELKSLSEATRASKGGNIYRCPLSGCVHNCAGTEGVSTELRTFAEVSQLYRKKASNLGKGADEAQRKEDDDEAGWERGLSGGKLKQEWEAHITRTTSKPFCPGVADWTAEQKEAMVELVFPKLQEHRKRLDPERKRKRAEKEDGHTKKLRLMAGYLVVSSARHRGVPRAD